MEEEAFMCFEQNNQQKRMVFEMWKNEQEDSHTGSSILALHSFLLKPTLIER